MAHRQRIDVGGYHLFMESAGAGSPTVLFESGMGCGADSLANLAAEVQQFTRAVLYDRAGLGQSDPAPTPRTSQDVVNDLWRLLQQAQIDGPYLLVGHSFAGLHLRLFAHQHPAVVTGLVLLDASHPDQWLRDLQLLPAPAPSEPTALTAARNTLTAEWTDPYHNEEGMDIAASAAQVQVTDHFGQLPLVVITAGIDEWEDGFPPEIARASATNWLAMQKELAALSHNSKHIIARESDHSIQDCQPELVVDVIRQMVQRWNNMQANLLIPESAWVVNDYPSEQTIQMLRERLREYNAAAANTRDGCQLALFLHDEQGDMMAGICGRFWGECLEIDTLWVEATWRGQGIGKRLMQTLETEAVSRGCRQITLTTFSFQAPEFYQKLGYQVFGVFGGFGNGHQKFYLQKRIE